MTPSVRRLSRWSLAVFFAASAALACTLHGQELIPPSPVTFKPGGDELTPEAQDTLTHVAEFLAEKKHISLLRIEGHVDQGTQDGQALSERRARAVAKALVAHGVDCKRLLPVGFGGAKPVSSDSTPEGKGQNQRVTFVVAALMNRPIGGTRVDGGGQVAGDPCAK